MLPLSGVRIADRTDDSGAFCAALLADLGADVARDATLTDADAVVLTGTPAALVRTGLDPTALLARHPHLIVAVISPFGQSGPRAEWKSCDTVAQALGGMLFVNGHADEPPLRGLGPQAHHGAGLQAAIGIMLALLARREHGRGQVVDASLHESTVALLEHVTGLYRERGLIAERQGTLHWSGTFRVASCRDGAVLLSHLGDWTALLEWVKSDGAAGDLVDLRWEDAERRRREGAHIFDVLASWAARYRVAELVEQAQLRRLPFAPVWPLGKVVQHPQLWARGFFLPGENGAVIRRGGPFRFSVEGAAPSAPGAGAVVAMEKAPTARRPPTPPPAATARRPPVDPEEGGAVLRGIRVLDFTWVVAGPVATRVLADHGADVIKIERLDTPDGAERRGGLFGNLNRGKRSVAIDLRDRRGIALARALARRCDVMIDNFSPRVLVNWGLDHATLCRRTPRLIAVSLSGFGASGPLADAVSYGPTLHAQTGCTWHMRHPGGAPAGWGVAFSDMASGYCAALAVLAALWERAAQGGGRCIDLAQLECLAAMLAPLLRKALRGAPIPDALGNRSPEGAAAPDGVYRCGDDDSGRQRWCAISVFDDAEWHAFAAAIGSPPWSSERRFATPADRSAHRDELDRLVERWTRARSPEAVMHTLQAAGVAAGLVADARDLATDPQLAARGYWARCSDGTILDGVVPRLSHTPGAVAAPGPRLGEHTDDVLHELLGMEQSAIGRLRRDAIIR
jgi:crotonobetainyl-CoA:carnitine CoA-transferase CaiB-like acyl-CoA transferase